MNSAIKENIKRQLQAKNMTAAELERRTGIPHAVVNILHGRSKNPSIKTAQAIAKELGCSIEALFAEDDAPKVELAPSHWNPQLYAAAFAAVYAQIQTSKLQPTPQQVGQWLTDVYTYALGSTTVGVDARFVEWLLDRDVPHNRP